MKYTYKTETDKNGNSMRYKCWIEVFKDEDSGKPISIKRHELIKVNGEKVRFYGMSELKRMSPSQRKSIQIKFKKAPNRR